MNYTRHLENNLKKHFDTYKQAIVLLGARQTGKTTLLKRLFPKANYLLLDNEQTKKTLETYDISTYSQILGKSKQVIIDELHLLSDPGRAVKIIYDQMPKIQLVVTGSSALHIKNKSTESMAGRKIEYKLYPLTFSEYLMQRELENKLNYNILENIVKKNKQNKPKLFSPKKIVEHVLVYGLYPEQIHLPNPRKYLIELANSAIFKDIVELNLIENRTKAKELLKLLAYQIGNLINYSEIGNKISLDRRTVEKYIDIFEQSYILFRLYPYSSNKRGEIGKSPKIYFHDIGLRNAIIDNFESSVLRPDMGVMFENFIVSELKKAISYQELDFKLNYWRLKTGSELDIILSNSKELYGIEVKLQNGQATNAFINRYPKAKVSTLNKSNFY
jgi:uncharacterized protein